MYATIPRLWPGSTIVCVASGPSLTQADVDYCRGRARVITVNESILMAPWADVCYAHHAEEWDRWKGLPGFQGRKYAYEIEAAKWGVEIVKSTGPHGLELDPAYIRHGYTGSYQALNMSVHFGAAKVILLGYDMCLGPNEEVHWHKGIAPSDWKADALPFRMWLDAFQTIVEPLRAAGVEVVNCTRRTAMTCFPQLLLSEAL